MKGTGSPLMVLPAAFTMEIIPTVDATIAGEFATNHGLGRRSTDTMKVRTNADTPHDAKEGA